MDILKIILLSLLVICAVSVPFTKKILSAVVVYMAYSLVMAVIWLLLESPDLAITEAAVGAGVSGVLFYMALKRMGRMKPDSETNYDNSGSEPEGEARDEE